MDNKQPNENPESQTLRYLTLTDLRSAGFPGIKAHGALVKNGILEYVDGEEKTDYMRNHTDLNLSAILLKETEAGIFQRFVNARDKINQFTDKEKDHLVNVFGNGKINLNAAPNIIKYALPLILVFEYEFNEFGYTDTELLFSRLEFFIRHRSSNNAVIDEEL